MSLGRLESGGVPCEAIKTVHGPRRWERRVESEHRSVTAGVGRFRLLSSRHLFTPRTAKALRYKERQPITLEFSDSKKRKKKFLQAEGPGSDTYTPASTFRPRNDVSPRAAEGGGTTSETRVAEVDGLRKKRA